MRALVTGAAGFIGNHVVRALLGRGHAVRALHLPGEDLRNLAGLDVERIAGDVTRLDDLRAAAVGVDWIFHLAAVYALWDPDPARMHRVNVDGARNVLRAAREAGVARVIHCSSIARFGGQGCTNGHGLWDRFLGTGSVQWRRATEASAYALGPTGDVYSATKYAAHELARAAADAGEDVVIVAPTGPIGPGDVGPTPTGRLLLRILEAPVAVVTPSICNFADVRDIAEGHVLAAERGVRGESYLLGGDDHTFADLARVALGVVGRRRPIAQAPALAVRLAGHAALWWSEHASGRPPLLTPAAAAIAELGLAADCSRAARELGLRVRPIEASIRDALEWFARAGYLRDRALRRRLEGSPAAA
ncbi:MAG: NAD-dependent epimerase/dehydratase family protein [Nannocystaceae bacterium]